jgi:hypothetical protein
MKSTSFDWLVDSSGEKKTMVKTYVLSRWEMPEQYQYPLTVKQVKKKVKCGSNVIYQAVRELGGNVIEGVILRST